MDQPQVRNGHISISWPMLGFAMAFVAAVVGGSVQLGGVQTHVVINTQRLTNLESHEREHLIDIARTRARQDMNEDRIKTLENGTIARRTQEDALLSRISAMELLLTDRLSKIESRIGSIAK